MDALLPFTPELLGEPLILLRDTLQLSGSFMIPVLMKLALQAGHAVVLVAVAQGPAHHQQALRKLGVNMAVHVQSGQLAVVDTLTDADLLSEAELQAGAPELLSRVLAAISTAQQLPPSDAASGRAGDVAAHPAAVRSMNGLQALADVTSNAARWSDGEQPAVCLLIDDLTAIGSLIADDAMWQRLLTQLVAIVKGAQPPDHGSIGNGRQQTVDMGTHNSASGPVSLTALLHMDVDDGAAQELATSQVANVVVDIEPLTAGQSADVSGRIHMQLSDCSVLVPWGSSAGDCQRRFFVKVSDQGVRFFQQYTAA